MVVELTLGGPIKPRSTFDRVVPRWCCERGLYNVQLRRVPEHDQHHKDGLAVIIAAVSFGVSGPCVGVNTCNIAQRGSGRWHCIFFVVELGLSNVVV